MLCFVDPCCACVKTARCDTAAVLPMRFPVVMQAQYNYPYPTPGYGSSESPAFPVRVACEALAEPNLQGVSLLKAMLKALDVLHPSSSCFYIPSGWTTPSSTFDYQVSVSADQQGCCMCFVKHGCHVLLACTSIKHCCCGSLTSKHSTLELLHACCHVHGPEAQLYLSPLSCCIIHHIPI